MLNIPIPAIRGKHSNRLVVYQTVVPANEIEALLGHNPSRGFKHIPNADVREIYEKVQRKTDSERKKRAREYVKERMLNGSKWIGAFPALSICVRVAQKFEANGDGPDGKLLFSASPSNIRILSDGLGRVSALLGIIEDSTEAKDVREACGKVMMAATIFSPKEGEAPLTIEEMQQLFHDFNVLGATVGKGMAIDLDHSDRYVQMVNQLAVEPVFANNGGIDHRAQSLSKASKHVATKISLVKFVRAALEGPGSHVDHYNDSIDNPHLTAATFDQNKVALVAFLERLGDKMGDRFLNRSSIHLSSPGWIALGLVYHDLFFVLADKLGAEEQAVMVDRIGQIDWSTANPDFTRFLGAQVMDHDTQTPIVDAQGKPVLKMYGGSKAFYNLAAYVRYKIGLDKLLAEPQAGNPDNFAALLGEAATPSVAAA